MAHALTVSLCAMTLVSLAGCEQAASLIGEVGGGARAENAMSFRARVIGVTDGDTITVLDEQNQQHEVRLAEVDAPERGQPWGERSRQALSALVVNKAVSVQETEMDRYGRVVARVFSEGRDVNRAMVEQGDAWTYRRYLTDETLIATEARARRHGIGLWSMSDAQTVAPWEWRQGVRVGTRNKTETPSAPKPQSLFSTAPHADAQSRTGQFSCAGKQYCRQMNSCAEANFYLRQCGVSSLDGNTDGEPCEMLCRTASQLG